MHMAAFPLRESGFAAEDLGCHSFEVDTLCNRDMVRAVRRSHRVIVAEVLTDPRPCGLVARCEVKFARDRSRGDIECGLFPLQVLLLQPFLVVAGSRHIEVHFLEFTGCYHTSHSIYTSYLIICFFSRAIRNPSRD